MPRARLPPDPDHSGSAHLGVPHVLARDYPLVYLRGDDHLVVINPLRRATRLELDVSAGSAWRRLLGSGVQVTDGVIEADGLAHGVFVNDTGI